MIAPSRRNTLEWQSRRPSPRSEITQGRWIGGAAADQIGSEAQDDSRGGAHFFPGRKRHGGELQSGRKRLCSEASGLSRVCQRHSGTRGFLGNYQAAAIRKYKNELSWK
jgi:hypothetical protein